MAGKIFVNYRRDDAKAEAARLHDRLAQSFGAANVFMDVDNLLPGERFDLRLKQALAGTDVFLAVIGARWLELLEARAKSGERDYVREEIAAALAAKIVVIPVFMDRAPLPSAASLPEDIRELALYHKHDVVHESFGRDVHALIEAIEAHRQSREEQKAEAARLAREKEQAGAGAARQKAKEEAEAGHRVQQRESRAIPAPEPSALPWKLAVGVLLGIVAIWLLTAQPWQPTPPPSLATAAPAPQSFNTARASLPLTVAELAALRPKDEFQECDTCPRMVMLPAGSFLMGSPENEPGRENREGPQHRVRIPWPLAAGRSHVTRAEFAVFAAATGYKPDGACDGWSGSDWAWRKFSWENPGFEQDGDHPVVCINWDDANAYVAWLNGRIPGKPYRLLTEAEAEYAAHGVTAAATQPRYFFGDDEKKLCRYANGADETARASGRFPNDRTYAPCKDGHVFTAPIASFKPNAFGLYDIHGNVFTWTQDCWNENYNGAPSDGTAWTAGDCRLHVIRGGSWISFAQLLRSASRDGLEFRYNIVGFRLARTL